MGPSRALLVLGLLLSYLDFVCASTETNVTVDDQAPSNSSILDYLPPMAWNQGAGCSFCSAKPDESLAFDGTWHDAPYSPGDSTANITISFTGTAIYTFFIVPDRNSPETNLNFTLDGVAAGNFHHTLGNVTPFLYNVSTFGRTGLENVAHSLIITSDGNTNSLFDYLIYTRESIQSSGPPSAPSRSLPPPSPLSPPNTNVSSWTTESEKKDVPIDMIVGPVVGGTFAIILLLAILFLRQMRRKHRISRDTRAARPLVLVSERLDLDPYMIRHGATEPRPEKAALRRAVAGPIPLDGSDQATASKSNTWFQDANVPSAGEGNDRRGAIPHHPPTRSSMGVDDLLPRYESLMGAD